MYVHHLPHSINVHAIMWFAQRDPVLAQLDPVLVPVVEDDWEQMLSRSCMLLNSIHLLTVLFNVAGTRLTESLSFTFTASSSYYLCWSLREGIHESQNRLHR